MLELGSFVAAFSSPFWTGVATCVAVFTTFIALMRFSISRTKRIFFDINDSSIVVDPKVPDINVKVSYNNVSGTSLHCRALFVINKTKGAIDDSDFVGPPFTLHRQPGVVYSIGRISSVTTCDFSIKEQENCISIEDLRCPRGSGFGLEIFHDGCISGPLVCHAKDADLIKRYHISNWSIHNSLAAVFLSLAVGIGTGTLLSISSEDQTVQSALRLIAVLGPVGLLISFLLLEKKLDELLKRIVFTHDAERAFIDYSRSAKRM